jgi:hypothetical protein
MAQADHLNGRRRGFMDEPIDTIAADDVLVL